MTLLLLALLVLGAGGAAALVCGRNARAANAIGAGSAVLGSALGLIPALHVLGGGLTERFVRPWSVPGGSFSLAIDPLSAFFLVPIFALAALAAVYGAGYLAPEARHRSLGPAWLWFNSLTASMALVVVARNALLFLVAWEAMALTSYFLVVFHHEREEVQRAGRTYLVATHLGTAFLLALFGALARQSGSLEFVDWRPPFQDQGALFALALVGFGTKAGLFPLHVWLPEAHPAAPSHVSALLSGAMIKTGIYGLLRVFAWMGSPPEPWALILIAIALVSGVLGVLSALAQRDLKRVLAYSSVENVGIIALGIGLAMVALDSRLAGIAALALAGSLLHVWNHALFKGLLFLAAGSIGRSAGTLELEQLGGLLRRMPWTGGVFVLGAAASCGLPPLNGFVGEFLIFLASFGSVGLGSGPVFPFLAGIAGLALVGGLSAACFARAAGIALLGRPRSEAAASATEAGPAMRAGMLPLAAGCLILGVAGPLGLAAAARAVAAVIGERQELGAMAAVVPALWQIGATGVAVVALALVFAALRHLLLRGREPRVDVTWDCGYAAPTHRMQYTASSFAEPLTRQFAPALGVELAERSPRGAFPGASSFESRVQDLAASGLFAPAFRAVAWLASRVRPLQSGSTHLYVLYVVLAALVLAIWRLG